MKSFLVPILIGLLLFSCSDNQNEMNDQESESEISAINPTDTIQKNTQECTYRVLLNETGNEWGYQLFQGSKMVVNQMHIPAIQGKYGFETKEKAEIAAEFVLSKLENNIFPPAISPEELDSLGVLPNIEE